MLGCRSTFDKWSFSQPLTYSNPPPNLTFSAFEVHLRGSSPAIILPLFGLGTLENHILGVREQTGFSVGGVEVSPSIGTSTWKGFEVSLRWFRLVQVSLFSGVGEQQARMSASNDYLFSEGSDQRRKVLAPRSLEAPSDWAVGEMCGKMDGGFSRMRLLMVLFVPVIPG